MNNMNLLKSTQNKQKVIIALLLILSILNVEKSHALEWFSHAYLYITPSAPLTDDEVNVNFYLFFNHMGHALGELDFDQEEHEITITLPIIEGEGGYTMYWHKDYELPLDDLVELGEYNVTD